MVRKSVFKTCLKNTQWNTDYNRNCNRDQTKLHRDGKLVTNYLGNCYTVLDTSGFAEIQVDNVVVEVHQLLWDWVKKARCKQLLLLLLLSEFHQLFFCEIVVGRKHSQKQEYDRNNNQYCYQGLYQSSDGVF